MLSRGSGKPRLLLLSHRLPFPTHNGAAIRSWNIFRLLARTYEVHAICFDRRDRATAHLALDARMQGLDFCASIRVFDIPQQYSRARLVLDHARSMLTGRPYTWFVHESPEALAHVEARLGEGRWALVHIDSMDLIRFLPLLVASGVPVACTHHNVESQLLERRADREPSALRAFYLRWQAARLAAAEREWLPKVAVNAAVSPDDAALLESRAPGARTAVIANGVDTAFFQPAPLPEGSTKLVFVGGTSWFPNLDALRWVAAEVLPAILRRCPTAHLTWVGRVTEAERAEFGGVPGLMLAGYVDDIRPYLAESAVFLAPMRTGGGTRLKLLDAMASGKAIVATTLGAEGLGAMPGDDLLVADDVEAFASAVDQVLTNAGLRTRLERAARALAEAEFSWEVIGARQAVLYQATAATV